MKMSSKNKKLFYGLLLDGIGMLSLAIPGLGEFLDILWAPVAGWFMTRMYPGRKGKIAGVIAFLEELLPGFDLIPSFTLMWFYTYMIDKAADPATESQKS